MTKDTTDRDLFCLHCGYNLRGLQGDPRRCPECGQENSVADLLVPADRITKALRKLEAGPAMATGAFVVLVAWLAPALVVLLQSEFRAASFIMLAADIAGIVVCIAVYVVGVRKFRTTCRGQPGWTSALVRHHLFGLLAAACVVTLIGAFIFLAVLVVIRPRQFAWWMAATVCTTGLLAFGGTWLFGFLAKRAIAPLQRACAAQWVQEHPTTPKT